MYPTPRTLRPEPYTINPKLQVTASGAELHIALDEPSFVYYAVVVTGRAGFRV